jgi:hypothetical protein
MNKTEKSFNTTEKLNLQELRIMKLQNYLKVPNNMIIERPQT